MKYSNKFLFAAALTFLPACTRQPQEHFRFGQLENPLLQNLTVENKDENTIQARSAGEGILLKAKEYAGGEQQFSNLKAKMEFGVQAAFGSFRASYPGMISKIIDCDPSLLPKKIDNPETGAAGFLTKANERLNFGVCDRQELKFDLVYAVMRCGERLYEIKAYLPLSGNLDSESLFRAFQCQG